MKSSKTAISARTLVAALLAFATLAGTRPALAQSGCSPEGYRVVARRWDVVLKTNLEVRQNCAHPEWPTHMVTTSSVSSLARGSTVRPTDPVQHLAPIVLPLLVHAGDPVRLWMQDEHVRIEMSGVAEQSARTGERVVIRITHQTDDTGLTVERIAGIVRGEGNVEMER